MNSLKKKIFSKETLFKKKKEEKRQTIGQISSFIEYASLKGVRKRFGQSWEVLYFSMDITGLLGP